MIGQDKGAYCLAAALWKITPSQSSLFNENMLGPFDGKSAEQGFETPSCMEEDKIGTMSLFIN